MTLIHTYMYRNFRLKKKKSHVKTKCFPEMWKRCYHKTEVMVQSGLTYIYFTWHEMWMSLSLLFFLVCSVSIPKVWVKSFSHSACKYMLILQFKCEWTASLYGCGWLCCVGMCHSPQLTRALTRLKAKKFANKKKHRAACAVCSTHSFFRIVFEMESNRQALSNHSESQKKLVCNICKNPKKTKQKAKKKQQQNKIATMTAHSNKGNGALCVHRIRNSIQ